jgi:hypothetical protein
LQASLNTGVAIAPGICINKALPPLTPVKAVESDGEIAFQSLPSAAEEIRRSVTAPRARREGASLDGR